MTCRPTPAPTTEATAAETDFHPETLAFAQGVCSSVGITISPPTSNPQSSSSASMASPVNDFASATSTTAPDASMASPTSSSSDVGAVTTPTVSQIATSPRILLPHTPAPSSPSLPPPPSTTSRPHLSLPLHTPLLPPPPNPTTYTTPLPPIPAPTSTVAPTNPLPFLDATHLPPGLKPQRQHHRRHESADRAVRGQCREPCTVGMDRGGSSWRCGGGLGGVVGCGMGGREGRGGVVWLYKARYTWFRNWEW